MPGFSLRAVQSASIQASRVDCNTIWLGHSLDSPSSPIYASLPVASAQLWVTWLLGVSSSIAQARAKPVLITIHTICEVHRWMSKPRWRPLGTCRRGSRGLRRLYPVGLDVGQRWTLHFLLVGSRRLCRNSGSHSTCQFGSDYGCRAHEKGCQVLQWLPRCPKWLSWGLRTGHWKAGICAQYPE